MLLALLAPSLLLAREVPSERAQRVAAELLAARAATRSVPSLELVWDGREAASRSQEAPAFYLFNRTDAPGFVIVAGDDAVEPVLAYSTESVIGREGMPESLVSWLEGVREQVVAVREAGIQAPESVRRAWEAPQRAARVEVEHATALWDQEWPYNMFCPRVGGSRTVTGCVPTAMAIYMRYHRWPGRGEGSLPSYTYSSGSGSVSIDGHDLGHPYDWERMPLRPDAATSEGQQREIATLMYDLGVMSQAMFCPVYMGGTGAITSLTIGGLTRYMGYARDARFLLRMWYADEEWVTMLKEELRRVGPVLYGGCNAALQGHEFILDGFDTEDYFHVNWGWSGKGNGFYRITDLAPSHAGAGGMTGSGYNSRQNAAFGLVPSTARAPYVDQLNISTGQRTDLQGFTLRSTRIERGVEFLCDIRYVFNQGLSAFVGAFHVALCDREGNFREQISPDISVGRLESGYGREFEAIRCRITVPIGFGDVVRLRYKGASSEEWRWMPGDEGSADRIVVRAVPVGARALERATQLAFDSRTRELTLCTLPGTRCTVVAPDGVGVVFVEADEAGLARIATAGFGAGAHTLDLQCGEERKSLSITFK